MTISSVNTNNHLKTLELKTGKQESVRLLKLGNTSHQLTALNPAMSQRLLWAWTSSKFSTC